MNGSVRNDDNTIGGSPALQENIYNIKEYDDIFSYSVKGRSMDVPPMEFDVDKRLWEAGAHRLATDKHREALSSLIDELMERGVIRPSKAWSQIHLVRKPSRG